MIIVTPDSRDMSLLRLAGRYRWLPFEKLCELGFEDITEDIKALAKLGLIGIARNKRYIKPTPKGYALLSKRGCICDFATNRAYSNSAVLRRRLETAEIMLTCLRAGIDVLPDNVDALRIQPTFFPAFAFRSAEINTISNCVCAGFGHWGNTAYMLHYISPDSRAMFLSNELKTFHNLSSVFSAHLNEREAMIFAGESYKQVYEQITAKNPVKRNKSKSLIDFADVYKNTDLPIHLLSCDETGAMQLALMRQPDYKARIAKAAFGSNWTPHDDTFPEADGSIQGGLPIVIAADMDIRRVQKVVSDAKRFGNKEVFIAAFMGQMKNLIGGLFADNKSVRYLIIEQLALDNAFGKDFSLYSMDKANAEAEGGTPHG